MVRFLCLWGGSPYGLEYYEKVRKEGILLEAITAAVQTALFAVQNDAMTLIGSVLPYALGVMGAVLVISIGIKVFKKVTGR